jgi:hypothetical protein
MKHIYLALIASFLLFNSVAQSVARFDELNLAPESYWNGSDLSGSFKSADFTFYNSHNKDWGSWSGFAYSNMTDIITAGYGNQYSAIAGSGNAGSANYAVCFPSAEVKLAASGKVSGFYVTNSTYAYLSMARGDAFSKKFGGETGNDPDFFKLTIEAIDAEGNLADNLDVYLADYRFADNSKDYILNKWTWIDLSELKVAARLRFKLSSSDNGNWGMNTPGYFCMDDFNGEKPYDYQPVNYAGFENLNLGTQGYFNGSDLKGSFTSGNFRFMNDYNANWGSWSGFAASNHTDVKTPGWENQYSAITGQGVAGTPTYAVVYPTPVSTILFKDTIVSGLYVTNSTYAYHSMKNGDAFSKKFGGETGNDEDYLILTIEGFNTENQSSGKIEFFLADFMYSINSNDYILDTWEWVNLSKLGRISKLEFSLRSSDNGNWGMNTPGYFCIDNLNHEVLTSSPNIQQIQASVYPNPFSDHITISGIKANARVVISDVAGRIVNEFVNVSNNLVINGLANLKSGVYFLEITEGKNRFTTKLMKK